MDTLDVLIFCEMSFKYFEYPGKDRRPSPKNIGSKLGVAERTVRLRTRKMERDGFIQYYQSIPNLRLFDRPIACLCNFQCPNLVEKPRLLNDLRGLDDVIDIADFVGESFGVTVSAKTESQAKEVAGRMAERIGAAGFQVTPPRYFSSLGKAPGKLDWQVLKALRYDALRPTGKIAKELGITYRMTDYSIRKLFDSQTVSTRAIINAQDTSGLLFYSVNLAVDETKQEAIVRVLRKAFGQRVWWIASPPGPMVSLFLFSTSVGRADDDLIQALSTEGVRSGSVTIFKGWVEPKRPSWIDRALDDKIVGN